MRAELHYEVRMGVAWLRLDRPAALNALSEPLLDDLDRAIDRAYEDPAVRVVVVTGTGHAFSAGADLAFAFEALQEGGDAGDKLLGFVARARAVLDRLASLPKPVIAAVNGVALAGGLELVLCCDLVIAAETARFGDAHANYGLLPGAGGAVRLTRKIGPTRAAQLLFTGEFVSAHDLVGVGLVNRVVPDASLEDTVQEVAETIASKSPLGLRRMKELIALALDQPVDAALRAEQFALAAHVHSRDLQEGLSAFREKRRPRFAGD